VDLVRGPHQRRARVVRQNLKKSHRGNKRASNPIPAPMNKIRKRKRASG
jgi:hypothetical protein